MGKVLRRVGAVCAAIAACALILTACTDLSVTSSDGAADVASANLDDFTFASMDVDYTLGRTAEGKSTLEVVERFVAVFPEYNQNHGMRRSIPDSYLGVPLNPRFVSITDGDGHPRAAEVDREDGTFTMTSRADDFVHGEQTYVFTYTLENVTRFFADTGGRRVLLGCQRHRVGAAVRRRHRDLAPRRRSRVPPDRAHGLLCRVRGGRRTLLDGRGGQRGRRGRCLRRR